MKKITLLLFTFCLAFSMNAQITIWEDDFETYTPTNNVGEQIDVPAGFLQYDVNSTGFSWGLSNPGNYTQPFGDIYTGNFMVSASFITTGAGGNGGNGAVQANNILVLPEISIPSGAMDVNLTYFVGSGTDTNFFSEQYSVTVTSTNDEATILAATPLLNTTLAFQGGEDVMINLDSFIGQDVFIAFRHHDTFDEWVLGIDNIRVEAATLSIEEFELNKIEHSFNQTTKVLTLDSQVVLNELVVYNILGQEALKVGLNNTYSEVNMSALQAGIYIAKISGDSASKTIKLIIK